MTLQTRRRTYWILFFISLAACLLGIALAMVLALRRDTVIFLIEHNAYKVHLLFGMRIPSHVLSVLDVLTAGIFSVTVGIFILRTFKKTVSAEIFFFAFWICSLSFDSLRLLHLILAVRGYEDSALAFVNKLYMGIKFLGTITIFISGLYASGMRNDKQFSIVSVCIAISAALVSILPVNTGIWGFNLLFTVGYGRLIEGFSIAVIMITIANCLIAVRVRGDRAFYYVTLGIAAVSVGAHFLSGDSSPLLALVSILAMSAGSFLYITKLHSFYLWQ